MFENFHTYQQQFAIMGVLIFLLYSIVTKIQSNIIHFFSRKLQYTRLIVYATWLLYLPGMLLHEGAHFIVALILGLHVMSINIIPKIHYHENAYEIRLGSVTYAQKDPIRGFFVGIAPFFIGCLALILLFNHIQFPSSSGLLNALFIYVSFVISSTMFSSRADMQDLLFFIPSVALIVGALYLFNVPLFSYMQHYIFLQPSFFTFLKTLNNIFFISICINVLLYGILKVIKKVL